MCLERTCLLPLPGGEGRGEGELQHDPNRPEEVLKVDADEDGLGGDDSVDALRYLLATKPRTITQKNSAAPSAAHQ